MPGLEPMRQEGPGDPHPVAIHGWLHSTCCLRCAPGWHFFLLNPKDVVELRGTRRIFAIVVWRLCPLDCVAQVARFRTTFKLDDAAPIDAALVLGSEIAIKK